ncbi:MAG: hypothetical protein J7639_04130 [Paenibacillaceae bacterium]|nr:hypothetical protein [Paenibacillaceae bacterium]
MPKEEENDRLSSGRDDDRGETGNDQVSRRKLLTAIGATGFAMLAGGMLPNPIGTAIAGRATVTAATYGGDGGEPDACCCIAVTIAELRAVPAAAADVLYLVRDRGMEGYFYYDSADSSSADNTGTIVVSTVSGARFKRVFEGPVNVRWFGADEGLADNAASFQQAIDYCATGTVNKSLYIPEGEYAFTTGLQVKCKIEGGARSILRYNSDTGIFLNGALGTGGLLPNLKNLTLFGNKNTNDSTHSVCLSGYTYRGTFDNLTILYFDVGADLEGVYIHFASSLFHNCRIGFYPRWLTGISQNSTMFDFDDCAFQFNGDGFLLERRYADKPVSDQELISLRFTNTGFEKNGNGLVVKIRAHLLTMINGWFEGNTGLGYDIHKSFPTMINVKVHPTQTVYVGDWASGYGANKGNYNRIDDGGMTGKRYYIAPFEPDSVSGETRKMILSYSQTSRNIAVTDDTSGLPNSNFVRTPSNGYHASVGNLFVNTDGTISRTSFPTGFLTTSRVAAGVYRVVMGGKYFYSPIIHATPYRNDAESPSAAICKVIPRNNIYVPGWRDNSSMTQFDVYCYNETGSTLVDAKVGITIHFTTSEFFT